MRKFTLVSCLLTGVFMSLLVNGQTLQRIEVSLAGTGVAGFSGDGGRAAVAALDSPYDVCMDHSRNLYFVDKANFRIRKISADKGIISTVAGGGSSTADGIPALNASIQPNFMTVDASGNLYFTMNNTVRKVSASTGLITTIAGGLTPGYTGDTGPASAATLNNPMGITTDASNNIYIVDRGNNVIREIFASTGYIVTIAGTGVLGYLGDGASALSATLDGPVVITVNALGNVYFSDQNPSFPNYDNSVIRMLDVSTGNIHTILGSVSAGVDIYNIPANQAMLGTITGVCTNPVTHDVYCDEMSCSCRYLNLTNDSLFEVAGNFGAQSFTDDINACSADMNFPVGMCMDPDGSGTIYIADCGNHRIRKIFTLAARPAFAFGDAQSIDACASAPTHIDSQLAVGSLDSGISISWSLLTPPAFGTVTGLPATSTSVGVMFLNYTSGVTYTPAASFSTPDSFQVLASDGVNSEVVTVYATSNCGYPTAVPSIKTNKAQVSVFPNPVSDYMMITSSSDISEIAMTNEIGQVVFGQKGNLGNSVRINTSSFAEGIYFVTINGIQTIKVNKN